MCITLTPICLSCGHTEPVPILVTPCLFADSKNLIIGFRTDCPFAAASENTFVPVSIFRYLGAHLECRGPYTEEDLAGDEAMYAGLGEIARRGEVKSGRVVVGWEKGGKEEQRDANEIERRASYQGED